MINTQFKLIYPMNLEVRFQNLDWGSENVIVRPEMLSICRADMRYYFGQRDSTILKKRLPLTLVHEACGTILQDRTGKYKKGQCVVMLPNIPGKDVRYQENYRLDSLFRSSRTDGFMQEFIEIPGSQVLPVEGISAEIASMTEFISVGNHAVKSYLLRKKTIPEHLAVWGDGALGYVVCALLKYYLPTTKLTVIGTHVTKLSVFQFTDEQLTTAEVGKEGRFDDVFECVGGAKSASAIQQMIDTVLPEGILNLLGVSEDPIPIATRMVLEKGLTLLGRSRSTKEDFVDSIWIMENVKYFADRIKILVSDIHRIREIRDMHDAFNQARIVDFKMVMDWKI